MKDEFSAQRAKQFSPFAALKGLEETLYERNIRPDERIFLGEDAAEELNKTLCMLRTQDYVSCLYYKAGKRLRVEGVVEKIFDYEREIKISGRLVGIDSIIELHII